MQREKNERERLKGHFELPGYYPVASAGNGYGIAQAFATAPATGPLTYQATVDPATALAYAQQLQSQQQQAYLHGYQPNAAYQAQLTQLLALRQAQAQQAQQEQLQAIGSQQVSFLPYCARKGKYEDKKSK